MKYDLQINVLVHSHTHSQFRSYHFLFHSITLRSLHQTKLAMSSSDVNNEMIKDKVLNMINVTVHLASIPTMRDMQSMQQWIYIDQDSEAAHNRLTQDYFNGPYVYISRIYTKDT